MKRSILIVEDDARLRNSLGRVLRDEGFDVTAAEHAREALDAVAENPPDLVISDVRMPGMTGMELLRRLKQGESDLDVVLMTAYDDLPTVAAAMKDGAADFLVKPLDLHQLRAVIRRIFEDRRARERADPPDAQPDSAPSHELIGRDPRMVDIFKLIGQLSTSRANVVIRGESGTGKELIARALHSTSQAAKEPFVAVNCTAIPSSLLESELFGHVRGAFTGASANRKGRFALAGRGTLFLDEIGDTTPDFQAKLLRVLQEREFYPVGAERPERTEARVIAATHRDLEAMVERGQFREDLYYRLRVIEIRVPPLRERRGDIPLLARHLAGRAGRAAGRSDPAVLSSEAIDVLTAHDWPGNVRELENCLVRAVVLSTGDVIRPHHLSLNGLHSGTSRLPTLDEVEAAHVARVLELTGGNRTHAAEMLGVSRPRLRRMIERHGLEDGFTD